MKRIYLDWAVVSSLKKEGNARLRDYFMSKKTHLFFVYSSSHFDDLMKSQDDIRFGDDIKMLESLVDDHLLLFDGKRVAPMRCKPSAYYEIRKKEKPIKLAEYGDILCGVDGDQSNGNQFGHQLKQLLQSIPAPFPNEMLSEDALGAIFADIPDRPSVLDIIQSAGAFVDRMQDGPSFYKAFRKQMNEKGFRLDSNSGNWDTQDAIRNISSFLRSKGLNKSFMEYVQMPFASRSNVSDFEVFMSAYQILDMIGYHADKLSKQESPMNNMLVDAEHAYYASFCDVFITSDTRLRSKAEALYPEFGICTKIIAPEDAMGWLEADNRFYGQEYFHSFMESEFVPANVVEWHKKETESDADYVLYKFSQRFFGIFTHGAVSWKKDSPNTKITIFEIREERSSSFLFYDEVLMMVDSIAAILSAEPIPDYNSIREQFIVEGSKISICWKLKNASFTLIKDEANHRPLLVLAEEEYMETS